MYPAKTLWKQQVAELKLVLYSMPRFRCTFKNLVPKLSSLDVMTRIFLSNVIEDTPEKRVIDSE